jgi:hypothetical protein
VATYSATVGRVNNGDGTVTFNVDILYGGVDVGVVPGAHEIILTLVPLVAKAGRQITHTLDQYDHDTTHLYAKATVLFDAVPAWLIEVNSVLDATTPTGHAYWASLTRIDASAPISITETVN